MTVDIRVAASTADLATAESLIREYQRWLDVDLCFQDFEAEMASLPGAYAPPLGILLIAVDGERGAGCIGVRPLPHVGDEYCEMKRLYVRDPWRGAGLGRRLADLAVDHARRSGFKRMVLDTLPQLTTAKKCISSWDFRKSLPIIIIRCRGWSIWRSHCDHRAPEKPQLEEIVGPL